MKLFTNSVISLLLFSLLTLLVVSLSSGPEEPVSNTAKLINLADILTTATTPLYDDLARYPERYRGQAVTFEGKIVQIAGADSHIVARVNITQDKYGLWSDTIWVNVNDGTRLLEGDLIKLWGTVKGEREYRAVLGQSIRIPEVDAVAIEIVKKVGEQ